MAEKTGIAWADSTYNPWIGCTKVGPGCDFCYAENVGARLEVNWGAGAPRRLSSAQTRNMPLRWQRGASAFLEANGHPRRVFCSSLADVFDNEVANSWRVDAFDVMEATPDLRWMICTKRVSNIAKMVPARWIPPAGWFRGHDGWPPNVGVLITTVTPEEVARDVPRLVELKHRFGIPWVGLSIEPMIADVAEALLVERTSDLDWVILGGESGSSARPCDLRWMRRAIGTLRMFKGAPAIFVKQMGDKPVVDGEPVRFAGKGVDPAEWPVDLRWREFPEALRK